MVVDSELWDGGIQRDAAETCVAAGEFTRGGSSASTPCNFLDALLHWVPRTRNC